MPIFLLLLCMFCSAAAARAEAPGAARTPESLRESPVVSLDSVTLVDLYCLRVSYPRIAGMETDAQGQWLLLDDGRRVLYASGPEAARSSAPESESAWVVDVRASMAEAYPLEPHRPETPPGVSPGRRRSYDLLQALYGDSAAAVGQGLKQTRLLGQPLHLAAPAAQAMHSADAPLAESVRQQPELMPLLKMDGGFVWRRIAGERRLSPHAFGIAFDISPHVAAYWRWSKLRPHPMQKTYPTAIVSAFEKAGFIWGGKWHEYDIMHFEYRPELICKARVREGLEQLAFDGPQ